MDNKNRKGSARGAGVKRADEIAHLYEWCKVVLNAMAELYPDKMKSEAESWMRSLDAGLREAGVSSFRMAARDLLEWVHYMPPSARVRIDQVLRGRFGKGLPEEMKDLADDVRAIVKRGKIEDEDEFRLLESWTEMLGDDPAKHSEVAAVTSLLTNYVRDHGHF